MGFLFFNFWRKRGGDFRRGTFSDKTIRCGWKDALEWNEHLFDRNTYKQFFKFLCNHYCNDVFCPVFVLSCISHVLCEPSKIQDRKCSLSYWLLHWKFCYHSEVSCWTWIYFQLYYEVFFPVKSKKWVIRIFPLTH